MVWGLKEGGLKEEGWLLRLWGGGAAEKERKGGGRESGKTKQSKTYG